MEERIRVTVDEDFQEIIPRFLENRRKEVHRILEALEQQDFEAIRVLGHGMKGFGRSYGFAYISELGLRLEQASIKKASEEIEECAKGLSDYLDRVDVVYG